MELIELIELISGVLFTSHWIRVLARDKRECGERIYSSRDPVECHSANYVRIGWKWQKPQKSSHRHLAFRHIKLIKAPLRRHEPP